MSITTARQRRGEAALLALRLALLLCAAGLTGAIGVALWRLAAGG